MKMHFSSTAFRTIDILMKGIYGHPFTVELIDGILPRERFLYYMQQDSLYLVAFGRALALVGAKMRNAEDVALMLYFAEQGLLAERELHEFYFQEYKVSPTDKKGPGCFSYCAHLLERAALGSPAEGMAALLPCFWIYREVGNHIRKLADEDNPYFKWIASYSSEVYSMVVDKAVALTDRLAEESSDEECQRMMEGFIASSRYEFLFWDDAYHLRTWPA
jgi:Putative transcription activator